MASSPGFGSTTRHRSLESDGALFRLAFALAPGDTPLAGRRMVTRRFVLQKARHHPHQRDAGDLALTSCQHTVSGSVSLPSTGCFSPFPHGTGALSVDWRIEPWRVVPPASHGISRVPRYSRIQRQARSVSPTGLSPASVAPSSSVRLPAWFVTCCGDCRLHGLAVQPPRRSAGRLIHVVGLG